MKNNEQKSEFLFDKINYKILLIGIGVITLGFILMSGGGSDDPKVFSEEIFNFRRIRLAPTSFNRFWNYHLRYFQEPKKNINEYITSFFNCFY